MDGRGKKVACRAGLFLQYIFYLKPGSADQGRRLLQVGAETPQSAFYVAIDLYRFCEGIAIVIAVIGFVIAVIFMVGG